MSTEIAPSSSSASGSASGSATGSTATAVPASSADRFMRRLLPLLEGKTATAEEARSAFQKSIVISAGRCILMYVFFPFVLPLIGVAKGVGPVIGLIIGTLAIVSIVFSVRRFWRANHSKRWHYTIFGLVIIAFLIVLAVEDFSRITS